MTCTPSCLCRCQQIGCGCRDAQVRREPAPRPTPALLDKGPTKLDRDYPQGDPEAITCRGCQRIRLRANGALFCRVCDAEAFLIAERRSPA